MLLKDPLIHLNEMLEESCSLKVRLAKIQNVRVLIIKRGIVFIHQSEHINEIRNWGVGFRHSDKSLPSHQQIKIDGFVNLDNIALNPCIGITQH